MVGLRTALRTGDNASVVSKEQYVLLCKYDIHIKLITLNSWRISFKARYYRLTDDPVESEKWKLANCGSMLK